MSRAKLILMWAVVILFIASIFMIILGGIERSWYAIISGIILLVISGNGATNLDQK